MKTKIVAILSVCAALAFVGILGAYSMITDQKQKEIDKGKEFIKQIDAIHFASDSDTEKTELTYDGIVSESDTSYRGCMQYTDGVYIYYYSSLRQTIDGIMQCPEITEEGFEISIDTAHSLADSLYKLCNADVDFSNVKTDISTALSGAYMFTYEEFSNQVGTGAIGSVCISRQGYIIGANFMHKEGSEVIEKTTAEPITETEARDVALTAIIDDIGGPGSYDSLSIIEDDSNTVSVHTFKGVTFWLIEENIEYTQGDQKNIVGYHIKINYYNGEVIEVASTNH